MIFRSLATPTILFMIFMGCSLAPCHATTEAPTTTQAPTDAGTLREQPLNSKFTRGTPDSFPRSGLTHDQQRAALVLLKKALAPTLFRSLFQGAQKLALSITVVGTIVYATQTISRRPEHRLTLNATPQELAAYVGFLTACYAVMMFFSYHIIASPEHKALHATLLRWPTIRPALLGNPAQRFFDKLHTEFQRNGNKLTFSRQEISVIATTARCLVDELLAQQPKKKLPDVATIPAAS